MINDINESLKGRMLLVLPYEEQQKFRSDIFEISKRFISEPLDDIQKISISLRLWSGCLGAAKAISAATQDGKNSPDSRKVAFEVMDTVSALDQCYKAGVETAPIWKELINQKSDVFFDGVPENSPVRRYCGKKVTRSNSMQVS
jgi:hypothetical protein